MMMLILSLSYAVNCLQVSFDISIFADSLTAALLGGAVQRVAQAFERIDVAGRGSAGRFALDLHGARPLHSFDELGLNLGLFDEGAFVLCKQLEFRGADRHRRLGA